MDSLFDEAEERAAQAAAPLAVRMRPRSLDEVIGQRHLTAPGTPFRKLIDNDAPMSLILWGPPGTGKTTLAYVVSQVTSRRFTELSAVTAGVKDVRAAVDAARRELGMSGRQTVLFIDEVHRFSKTQQDALLPAVENRWVSFIGATTENPSFSVVAPMNDTHRFSTAGSSASCCVLEKRCTSSMNSRVCLPLMPSSRRAASTAARTSLTPAVTADSSVNRRFVTWLTT